MGSAIRAKLVASILVLSMASGLALANDAGSGADAGNLPSSALPLSTQDATYFGNLTTSTDEDDYYSIYMPNGTGLYAELISPGYSGSNGTNSSSACTGASSPPCDFDLYLYDSNGAQIASSLDTDGYDEVTTNGTSVGGTNVTLRVTHWDGDGQYALITRILQVNPPPPQNDANSGGDASNSSSSPTPLNSTNATHFGYADNTYDEYDWYNVSVPLNHTIEASLSWNDTSADLDLHLFDQNGSYLDYSYDYNPENVSSGTELVGGTNVSLLVRAWASGDNYSLTIYFQNISSAPAFNQNDANSSTDAGNTFSSALSLPPSNGTYYGWISDGSDTDDIYQVNVPEGKAIQANLSWNSSSNDFDLALYDETQSMIDSSTIDNPEEVASGSTNVSNSTVFLLVQSSAGWWGNGGEGEYTLGISFVNLSEVPGLNQNDANSGGDAGNEISNATPVVNNTAWIPIMMTWEGYADSGSDSFDVYRVYVPADHGISAELDPGYTSSGSFELTLYDSSNSVIDSSYYSSPQSVTSNGSYVGGDYSYLEVYAYYIDGLYNVTLWIFSLDADGDGYYDEVEYECGSDPNDNASIPQDTDADGICDFIDEDIDGDGVDNSNDSFPNDANETSDNDGDGFGDNSDDDDDNDGWTDTDEDICGTDNSDSSSFPSDIDSDGICDSEDQDIDGDGYDNQDDSFDYDPDEWNDTDGDGLGDNSDDDDDGDGFYDGNEVDCLSDPLSASSIPTDTDSDGVCDELDDDLDGDGTINDLDDFPLDGDESGDNDGDGIGDIADPDDDNDGYQDTIDEFSLNPAEWADNDGDCLSPSIQTNTTGNGCGDNSDNDDDNDGWSDDDENDCGTNQFLAQSSPVDRDNDRLCDILDPDDDNDAWNDTIDAFPYDPNEWDDLDLDNLGSNTDPDDDGDGWDDVDELSICNSDPRNRSSVPDDFDGDRICDNLDDDDDNDMVLDFDDAFPYDPDETRDTDGDGKGDGEDTDDDDDGWADTTEVICQTLPLSSTDFPDDNDGDGTCDLVDPDDDNDGWPDYEDAFPMDSSEWVDRNSDGLGDNANPLTTMDKMRMNPGASMLAIGTVSSILAGSLAFVLGRRGMTYHKEEESYAWDDEDEDEYYDSWE